MKNNHTYPSLYGHLQSLMGCLGKEIPETMGGFAHLHGEAVKDGALSTKMKELVALAIAVAIRCDGCIAYHVHDALKAGATREEIVEALGVAILMGGGPSAMYACQASEALDQFESELKTAG